MVTALIILIVILAILLVLVVLAQNSKGGTFASNFSASNQLIGVKKTGDLLEKLTWGFSISLMILCIVVTKVIGTPDAENQMGTPATRSTTQQPAPNLAPPAGNDTAGAPATTPAPEGNTPAPADQPASNDPLNQ